MSGGINVDPEDLRTHASHVHDDAYELSRASGAALTASLDGRAFGKLVGFVGSWFMEQESELADLYVRTVSAMHDDAQKISDIAGDYDRADTIAAERVRASGASIRLPL